MNLFLAIVSIVILSTFILFQIRNRNKALLIEQLRQSYDAMESTLIHERINLSREKIEVMTRLKNTIVNPEYIDVKEIEKMKDKISVFGKTFSQQLKVFIEISYKIKKPLATYVTRGCCLHEKVIS